MCQWDASQRTLDVSQIVSSIESRAILWRMANDCSICSAPINVLRAVNDALAKREKLRSIAARSGFSKSSIHRHSQRCVPRQVLASHQASRFNSQLGRIFVQWPDHESCPPDLRAKLLPSHRLPGEHDILLRVEYEKPVAYDPRIESVSIAHDLALDENSERNAANSIPIDQNTTVN
jgi:hypothetical protein